MRLDRSFFELQAAFVRRAAEILDISETDAFRRFTTFYWIADDNDAGRRPEEWSFDPAHPAWSAFSNAIQNGTDPVDYVYRHHLQSLGANGFRTCFEYDYWAEAGWVCLHFGNSPDGQGLKPESLPARRAELHRIFSEVARYHPEAEAVRGCSWLYHVRPYRELFPPEFVARLSSAGYLHQFAALWGQFIDRHGKVKSHVGSAFRSAVASAQSLADLNSAFPRDVLAATCPIHVFYRHFEVTRK